MLCHKCGNNIVEGHEFCGKCGVKKTESHIEQIKSINEGENKQEGFGGWLAFLAFGVFLSPILEIFYYFVDLDAFGFDAYYFGGSIIAVIASVWLIYLMVKKKRSFKKSFLIINTIGAVLLILIFIYEGDDYALDAVKQTLYTIIWSLYLWKSKRAKNTFIKN